MHCKDEDRRKKDPKTLIKRQTTLLLLLLKNSNELAQMVKKKRNIKRIELKINIVRRHSVAGIFDVLLLIAKKKRI